MSLVRPLVNPLVSPKSLVKPMVGLLGGFPYPIQNLVGCWKEPTAVPDAPTYDNIQTVVVWYNHDGVDKTIIDLGIPEISVASPFLSTTGITSPSIYVNGVLGIAVSLGWNFIVVTTATGFDAGPISWGSESGKVLLYSSELTSIQILNSFYNTQEDYIPFPENPTQGQNWTYNGVNWTYNGANWTHS